MTGDTMSAMYELNSGTLSCYCCLSSSCLRPWPRERPAASIGWARWHPAPASTAALPGTWGGAGDSGRQGDRYQNLWTPILDPSVKHLVLREECLRIAWWSIICSFWNMYASYKRVNSVLSIGPWNRSDQEKLVRCCSGAPLCGRS